MLRYPGLRIQMVKTPLGILTCMRMQPAVFLNTNGIALGTLTRLKIRSGGSFERTEIKLAITICLRIPYVKSPTCIQMYYEMLMCMGMRSIGFAQRIEIPYGTSTCLRTQSTSSLNTIGMPYMSET